MYQALISLHSLFRWLVLLSLLYAITMAYKGYFKNKAFSKRDDLVRHWTATIAHIQLVIGFTLYLQSPVVRFFFANTRVAFTHPETTFFALIHISLMITAIVIITIGSAIAKRKQNDRDKFKTMLFWFLIGLLIIFMAIPWPFSPLANRPYFRNF